MAKTQNYHICLQEAHEFRQAITQFIQGENIEVSYDSSKQNCWDIKHKGLQHQLGAISYGGKEESVKHHQAVSYIEIRFDKNHLDTLKVKNIVEQIGIEEGIRFDKERFIKFQFHRVDTTSMSRVCSELHKIFNSKENPESLNDEVRWAELIKEIIKFRDERNWEQFHTPKDLAISISLEANELLENFQWKTSEEAVVEKKNDIKDELADVMIYSFLLADKLGIDPKEAILQKLKKNAEKYPVEKAYGLNKKYTEL